MAIVGVFTLGKVAFNLLAIFLLPEVALRRRRGVEVPFSVLFKMERFFEAKAVEVLFIAVNCKGLEIWPATLAGDSFTFLR